MPYRCLRKKKSARPFCFYMRRPPRLPHASMLKNVAGRFAQDRTFFSHARALARATVVNIERRGTGGTSDFMSRPADFYFADTGLEVMIC